jgi:hypothetical protein
VSSQIEHRSQQANLVREIVVEATMLSGALLSDVEEGGVKGGFHGG